MMRLEHLYAGYGGRDCLFDVNCAFARGEITGLIGPNGSGKSTLIKAAACQLPVSGGALFLEGVRLERPNPREIARRIAYMPQMRGAPPITVRQLAAHGRYPHLGFGRALSKADWEAVDKAMEAARVTAFARRPVNTLSGGERQRAYLSMLLAQDAPLMMLDEPTAFLDIGHQFELMELLSAMKALGKTVVVALHELPLALTYCDRLLVLSKGRPVLFAVPEEVSDSLEPVFGVRVHRGPGGRYAMEMRCAKGGA